MAKNEKFRRGELFQLFINELNYHDKTAVLDKGIEGFKETVEFLEKRYSLCRQYLKNNHPFYEKGFYYQQNYENRQKFKSNYKLNYS